jgi:hypothetical protein
MKTFWNSKMGSKKRVDTALVVVGTAWVALAFLILHI